MALTSQNIAPFLAASAFAGDGEYNAVNQESVIGLGEQLEMPDLDKVVAAEADKIAKLDDDEFDAYLENAAKKIKAGEKEGVLLLCMTILAGDGVISSDELVNYFTFAEVLGVSEERASEIFDDFVDEAEDLVIEDE